MSGSYWRQLQAAPQPRGTQTSEARNAHHPQQARSPQPARQRPDHGRVRGRPRCRRDRHLRCARRPLRRDLRRPRHGHGPRSRPRTTASRLGSRLLLLDERGAASAPLSAFPARAYSRGMPGELHLTYLNRPDVEALALTDDEILDAVESRPARAGPGRDGDRAARAPAARRGVSRPLQRAARLHRAARRWPASRSSATTSTTTSSGCPPRTACSRSTTRARACRRP